MMIMVIILNDFVCSKNIRYLREKYRVSRRALSRLVGISLCTLRDYEEERVIPVFTHRQLQRLSAVFDLPIEQLTDCNLTVPDDEECCACAE